MAADNGLIGNFLLSLGTQVVVPVAAAKYNADLYQKQSEVDILKAQTAALQQQLQSQATMTQTLQNWFTSNNTTIVKITNILLMTVAFGVLSYIYFSFKAKRRKG
jgi:ribosomal protein L16 Arg81 hydroxylase